MDQNDMELFKLMYIKQFRFISSLLNYYIPVVAKKKLEVVFLNEIKN